MPVILENTRFDPLKTFRSAVGSEGLPVNKVFHEKVNTGGQWDNHIYVQVIGKVDPDFKVGGDIAVRTPSSSFTGKIWYIYQGSTAYNLYVHPSDINASAIPDAGSGTVWLGTSVPTVTTNQIVTVDPAIDPTATPTDDAKTTEGEPSPTVTAKKSKTLLYVGAALALVVGVVLYFKLKKGKKG